jgi:hypothetical protein
MEILEEIAGHFEKLKAKIINNERTISSSIV